MQAPEAARCRRRRAGLPHPAEARKRAMEVCLMEDGAERFERIPEPSGKWSVWDRKKDAPAQMDGRALVGLDEPSARAACGILNRIYRGRFERCSGSGDTYDGGE